MTRRTAFRIYGRFHWPPLPNAAPAGDLVPGMVEIYYLDSGPDMAACVRWTHASRVSDAPPVPPEPVHIQSLSNAALAQRFTNPKNSVEFRLDDPNIAAPHGGVRLLFRGAQLFDQFNVDPTSEAAALDLRWLLARRYNQGAATYLSEVVVGHTGSMAGTRGATYGFNFALPTPAPQAVIVRTNASPIPSYGLPFRVRYLPVRPASAGPGPIEIHQFGAGPTGGVAADDLETFQPRSPPLERRFLGGFGFSRTDGGDQYFYFPRGGGRSQDYWLENRKTFVDEVLGKLGTVTGGLRNAIRFINEEGPIDSDSGSGDEGERWTSVGFIQGEDRTRTTINFRSAIFAIQGSRVDDGDIAVQRSFGGESVFMLRDPARPDRQILSTLFSYEDPARQVRNASDLLIDLEPEYAIPDEAIWTVVADPGAVNIQMRVRIGFRGKVGNAAGDGDLDDNSAEPDLIEPTRLFGDAIKGMRLARLDLQNLEPSQPQSLLPEIVKFEQAADAPVRFALCGTIAGAIEAIAVEGAGEVERIAWAGKRPRRRQWQGADLRLTLWPDEPLRRIETKVPVSFRATMALPSFAYPSAGSHPLFKVTLWHDRRAYESDADYSCGFRLRKDSGAPMKGRLGGIEFQSTADVLFSSLTARTSSTDDESENQYSYWRFGPRPRIGIARSGSKYWAANAEVRLRLAIRAAEPRGADIAWGDRTGRSGPLLIRLDKQDPSDAKYILDATERVSARSDRQLLADIKDLTVSSAKPSQYLVLSERPFSIVKFQSEPLQQRASQDNAIVAHYDSDTRSWQLKLVAPTYHYEFPPQSVGESMDKPRRLEIHDGPAGTMEQPVKPYPDLPDREGVVARRAVEFRLTPSAELWIRPTDVERGYFLPEWATFDIFRQNGALGLGAAMAAFRGEFLYGLAVGIDTAAETGPARGARVAEIEALLGRPPGEIKASAVDPDLQRRWHLLSSTIARRPERLEMWMRDPNSATPFAPARFAAGVRFALRETAVHNLPVKDDERVGPEFLKDKPVRLRPHGLMGGAIWPLESANFCRALLEAPESAGGTIERIALSPGGGDADQRAEFLNGQLAIISETRNGHVQRHRVEIIGRIGVFWHRAKHVVVYERTTNPSPQFTPDEGLGTRTRRPVLRKVSEYIELLQPVRAYPDFATAGRDSAGFLRLVRFNSHIINVDSAWSEDVGDFAWQIPLWNRRSARMRPSVYPRPDIAFVTAAEGEGESPVVAQECLEPDNIYFFADAKAGNADTDSWFAQIGIDCTNLPPPRHDHQPQLDDRQDDRRKPGASRIPRGHRRFTWRLAEAGRKTAVNAGRGDDPLYAGLESITFMRSTVGDAETASRHTAEITRNLDIARDKLKDPPEATFAGIADALSAFDQAIGSGTDAQILARAQELRRQLQQPRSIDWSYAERLGRLHDVVKGGRSPCEKLVADFSSSLHRKKLLILDEVRSWEREALDHFPTVADWFSDPPGGITDKDSLVKAIAGRLMDLIAPALDEVQGDVGNVRNSVEQARAAVRDFQAEIVRLLDNAERKLDETVATYDAAKPWSPSRLDEYHRKLASVHEGVLADIEAVAQEIQTRLATELGGVSHSMGAEVGALLRAVSAGDSKLRAALQSSGSKAGAFLREARRALLQSQPEVVAKVAALREKLDEAIAGAPNHAAMLASLRTRLDRLEAAYLSLAPTAKVAAERVESGAAQIDTAIAELSATLRAFVLEAKAYADEALAGLTTITEAGLQQLRRQLTELTGEVAAVGHTLIASAAQLGERPDWIVDQIQRRLAAAIAAARDVGGEAFKLIDDAADVIDRHLGELKQKLTAGKVRGMLTDHVVRPAVETLLADVDFEDYREITEEKLQKLRGFMRDTSLLIEQQLGQLDKNAADFFKGVTDSAGAACGALQTSLEDAYTAIEERARKLLSDLVPIARKIQDALDDAANAVARLRRLKGELEEDVRKVGRELSDNYAAANAYADRVFEAAGNITSGGLAAAPSNILRLWAAAASAPALPNLDFARERLGYYYNQINKYIDTTPAEAWFGRLGDELKAMGLSVPFSKIGDGLIPEDLSKLDIGRVFRNFGGVDLSKMFGGYKLPQGAKDAIKIAHAVDKSQFRTWVQIDVDLPMPGRKALFTVGPFKLDFVDSRLVGMVRLEASKDSDRVEQTGRASLQTNIDAVVSGQSMVTLQKVALNFERNSGLKVDFDPKNIKLNPSFRFIQETLASLFPDELGGLKIVKKDGIPVGVEHEFSMPPVSLMAGTSGVSNIQISNRFALIAYPDFVISDRFALSKPEMPFLFSIFIIGGTGYINVDCEYQPFKSQLAVTVEAAAGGSAALGFSAGPVSGAVFITLSVALSYRKVIGRPGGGLTASLVLLIAGNVDVAGIASVYIGLLLRMSYRENGDIDGVGTLTVTVRISRWFKISVRRNVQYQLRKGKSQTSSSTQVSTRTDERLERARSQAEKLLKARG